MARTPLLSSVQQIAAEVAHDARRHDAQGLPARRRMPQAPPVSRARSGRRPAARGAAAAGRASRRHRRRAGRADGGYRLRQAGVQAEVHEASTRLGGRCWSIRGVFADGQTAEHGGELIDTGHLAIRHLVQELGLDTRQPRRRAAERHRGPLLVRRRAVHLRPGDRRHQAHLAAAPQRPQRGELPDDVLPLDAARPRARPHVGRPVDRSLRPGRPLLTARPAARRRLQHRVRRGGDASRAR